MDSRNLEATGVSGSVENCAELHPIASHFRNESAGDRTQDPQIKSLLLYPAPVLEKQENQHADPPPSSAGRSDPAGTAPDLAAVLKAVAALPPEQRHALAALLSAPPS